MVVRRSKIPAARKILRTTLKRIHDLHMVVGVDIKRIRTMYPKSEGPDGVFWLLHDMFQLAEKNEANEFNMDETNFIVQELKFDRDHAIWQWTDVKSFTDDKKAAKCMRETAKLKSSVFRVIERREHTIVSQGTT